MQVGELLELTVERPVAGGRMLARHDGAIVFVAGAIPGERVRARVTRVSRQATSADVVEVLEPGTARRAPTADPACGGLAYAHIAYDRQLTLKGEIVADAFRRLARRPLETPPTVVPSPERGYRMRARLHVRAGRAGFFREGTHELCDPAATGQLLPETTTAIDAWMGSAREAADAVDAVTVVENVAASERVLLIEPRAGRRFEPSGPDLLTSGVAGVSLQAGPRVVTLAGATIVRDTAGDLFGADPPIPSDVAWMRRPSSFFQSNRHLIGTLTRRVLALAAAERVVDLYAGVGLFAVALAAAGTQVVAVEGDASSGADLAANAKPYRARLHVERAPVEAIVRVTLSPPPAVVIVDPPRTGLSAAALAGLAAWRAPRIVYVSCDPPTLARDAARLATAGYALSSIECLDLFPNTAHVETIASLSL